MKLVFGVLDLRNASKRTLSAGYRFHVDLSRRMQGLETVAKALNDNNPCLAAIALVQAQFPPLPDNAAGRPPSHFRRFATRYDRRKIHFTGGRPPLGGPI